MNKRGGKILVISLIILILFIIGLFLFFILYNPDNEKLYSDQMKSGKLINPAQNKSLTEAVSDFNVYYVQYLLIQIKAYNLHNPPLSSNTPMIEINVENQLFNAIVENGIISVYPGKSDSPDIIIKTTKEEIVSMLKDKNYVKESFQNKRSEIQLIASSQTLFSKGYISIYNELTDKGITGSVIRFYVS